MQRLDYEFGRGDLRRAMIAVYGDTCRIGWCHNRRLFSYKDKKRKLKRTIDHIYPLNPPHEHTTKGRDEIRNTTLACEYCNHKKSNSISHHTLMNELQQEAREHFNLILKELFKKYISLNGKNKGFYTISVLTHLYGVRITRKGSLVVVRERPLSSEERVDKRLRDKELYQDTVLSP